MSNLYSFEFLSLKPEQLNPMFLVDTREIGYPKRNTVTASVPYSSEEYDFSEIDGNASWSNRTVKYVIHVLNIGKLTPIAMHNCATQLVNWLTNSHGRQPLWDDTLPGYHFLGEVRDAPSLADAVETGEITVTFDCYAFMIRDQPEGNDRWNDFSFDTDVAQDTDFDVDGSARIILINDGAQSASPKVTADAPMTVTIGSVEYTLNEGVNEGLSLPTGTNWLTITGSGHISFEWYQEVI